MSRQVTVYGSLKKNKYNHYVLGDCKFIKNTKVKGTMYLVSSYPALVNSGENYYDAEIYEIDEQSYDRVYSMEMNSSYILIDGVFYADEYLSKYCEEFRPIITSY